MGSTPLTVPPIRTALANNPDGTPMTSTAPNGGPITTEKQWWFYWRDLGSQVNAGMTKLAGLITYGNHADRPVIESVPDGALYVEIDRGNVLYESLEGRWLYIAGTMWGTAGSPDQRPTDLGPADVGFDFRTNVPPAREFIWSGGMWVEVTPMLYGTHAQRLAGTIANLSWGMAWMETDRGNVIYQLQSGAWYFVAGSMPGTLSPDQRPTDLGVNDNGFGFRGTDQPRQFIWTGTAWLEVTSISGAVNLTHPNVVTKVGATAGSIVEGGITDLSAGNSNRVYITSGGNVGIGTGSTVQALFHVHMGTDQNILFGTTSGAPYLQSVNDALSVIETMQLFGNPILIGNFAGSAKLGINITPSFQLQVGADSAAKPATSTWSVVSDIRLKQNMQHVKDDSLAILSRLNWVRFEYNGQANMPRGQKAIGLVAQAVREYLPEAVCTNKTKLNETDPEEADVLAIDYHHIIVHSARAIQQLNAEVQTLRALIGKP